MFLGLQDGSLPNIIRSTWHHLETDLEGGSHQVARVPIKANGIQCSHALFGHGALLTLLVEKVLTALVLDPNIQRAIIKLGGDGTMSICQPESLQSFKASVPHSTVRVKDKSSIQKPGFTVIREGGMMSKLLSLELVSLALDPLSKLLVGWVRVRDQQMPMCLTEEKQFLEAFFPLIGLVVSKPYRGGWACASAFLTAEHNTVGGSSSKSCTGDKVSIGGDLRSWGRVRHLKRSLESIR